MRKEIVQTDRAPIPAGSYSQAVKFDNMVFVSGTCPFELGSKTVKFPGDVEKQTKLIYLSHFKGCWYFPRPYFEGNSLSERSRSFFRVR